MYFFKIRLTTESVSPFELVTQNVAEVANLLEDSNKVLYFTCRDSGGNILFPTHFGFGGYQKWRDFLFKGFRTRP